MSKNEKLRNGTIAKEDEKNETPDYQYYIIKDLWVQCHICEGMNYKKDFFAKRYICESCGFYVRMPSSARIDFLIDSYTTEFDFEEEKIEEEEKL